MLFALGFMAVALAGCALFIWHLRAELAHYRQLCMVAWTRLDELDQSRKTEAKERDALIRRLARAEAAMDGLRAIAQESAMLAQLDALRADSCWSPLHPEPEPAA